MRLATARQQGLRLTTSASRAAADSTRIEVATGATGLLAPSSVVVTLTAPMSCFTVIGTRRRPFWWCRQLQASRCYPWLGRRLVLAARGGPTSRKEGSPQLRHWLRCLSLLVDPHQAQREVEPCVRDVYLQLVGS